MSWMMMLSPTSRPIGLGSPPATVPGLFALEDGLAQPAPGSARPLTATHSSTLAVSGWIRTEIARLDALSIVSKEVPLRNGSLPTSLHRAGLAPRAPLARPHVGRTLAGAAFSALLVLFPLILLQRSMARGEISLVVPAVDTLAWQVSAPPSTTLIMTAGSPLSSLRPGLLPLPRLLPLLAA